MAGWPRTYQFLADSDDASADEALAAAARQLDGPYLRYVIEVLLHRAQPAGLPAVVENYHRLPADLKGLVLSNEPVLATAMRTAIRDSQLQTRVNCLEMASQIGSESLAYLFDLGLLDTQVKVRESAARMMRQMTLQLLADHPLMRVLTTDNETGRQPDRQTTTHGKDTPRPQNLALRRQHLFEALLSGAQRYETHLRPEIVEACIWFEPYLGAKLWELLRQGRSRLLRLAGDLMIRSDEPQAAYFLVQALAAQDLRPAALKAISERRDPKWFGGVLRGVEIWHPWPRVRKAWGFIKDITYLYTVSQATWSQLARSSALPMLAAASNLPAERKADVMCRMWQVGSADCRRQVLLEAGRGRDWGPDLLRTALAESPDRQQVRMAAYELLQMGYEGLAGDLARRLNRQGDPAAADLVALAADEIFWRLWTRFDTMQEAKRVAALSVIKNFTWHLKLQLRVRLASVASSPRIRAVRMAGMLGLVDELWRDVLEVAQDRNSRVRSAAVRVLGRSDRRQMKDQLLAALEDPDGRVQANAIEAIDEAGWPDRLALIMPKLHSENNRVRANAARVLARAGEAEAIEALLAMLQDPRPEHRLTAIWTIKTTGGGAWDDRLLDMAEHDPAPAVRRLAHSVYRQRNGQPAETPEVAIESPTDTYPSTHPAAVPMPPPPARPVSALQEAARKAAAEQAAAAIPARNVNED